MANNQQLTLIDAFLYTIKFKYYYRRCGQTSNWSNNIKKRYQNGTLSIEKMREVVVTAGYFYTVPEKFILKNDDDV
jgi:hypothetical protein